MPGSGVERLAELKYQHTERLFAAAYLLCVMALQAHFVHEGWYTLLHPAVKYTGPTNSIVYAPEVYRVGMQVAKDALQKWIPDASAQFTLLDFVFGYAALYSLYLLQSSRVPLRLADRTYRVITLAFFLAAIHFALLWVVPYERPETMPMALYLAAAGLLLVRVRSGTVWALGLVALTVVTAFVRSDVPCIFGLALCLLGLFGNTLHEIAPRRSCVVLGGAIAGTAAAVQAYLQFVRFSHATYPPGASVVMLHYNMRFHSLVVFATAFLPVLVAGVAAFVVRVKMHSLDWLCITAAAIYLPLWFAVGSTAEVRIYVPFLLLLCPLASRVLAAVLGIHADRRSA